MIAFQLLLPCGRPAMRYGIFLLSVFPRNEHRRQRTPLGPGLAAAGSAGDGSVRLKRVDDTTVALPFEKLSVADQQIARRLAGK